MDFGVRQPDAALPVAGDPLYKVSRAKTQLGGHGGIGGGGVFRAGGVAAGAVVSDEDVSAGIRGNVVGSIKGAVVKVGPPLPGIVAPGELRLPP